MQTAQAKLETLRSKWLALRPQIETCPEADLEKIEAKMNTCTLAAYRLMDKYSDETLEMFPQALLPDYWE